MRKLKRLFDLTKKASDFLETLPAKQYRQVTQRIFELAESPEPQDSAPLKGPEVQKAGLRRIDAGEYRIIYRYSETVVEVFLVGNRNDGKIYQNLDKK